MNASATFSSGLVGRVMREEPVRDIERRRTERLLDEADRVTAATLAAASEARREAQDRRARREDRLYRERLGR